MTRKEFERFVAEAIASLPEPLRGRVDHVRFRVAEAPNRRQARLPAGSGRAPSLYGLYEGAAPDGNTAPPDRITIFKKAIERDCKTRDDMVRCIQETVLHEIGHFFGMDDRQLDRLGIS